MLNKNIVYKETNDFEALERGENKKWGRSTEGHYSKSWVNEWKGFTRNPQVETLKIGRFEVKVLHLTETVTYTYDERGYGQMNGWFENHQETVYKPGWYIKTNYENWQAIKRAGLKIEL